MERLVLGRGAHVACGRQPRQERHNLRRAHAGRVALVVEKDELTDTADISVFRSRAQVSDPAGGADLVEELRGARWVGGCASLILHHWRANRGVD